MDNDTSKGTIEERLEAFHAPVPEGADAVKQPEPMPSSEQKPAEVSQVVPEEPAKEPEEKPVDEEAEALANSKNPERTKGYIEKLKKQLREKEEALAKAKPEQPDPEVGTSVFDIFHPTQPAQPAPQQVVQTPYLNQTQVQAVQQQFVSPDGTVDIDRLNRALFEANQRAQMAERRVMENNERIARFEETQQVRDAHAVYPELDPLNKDKFSKPFFKAVRDRMAVEWAYGRKPTLLQVATQIAQEREELAPKVNREEVEEQAVTKYKATQQARNQGPFEAGRGDAKGAAESYEELRARTRKRGPSGEAALTERLKRLGI